MNVIQIKDKQIPIIIRNYKYSKVIKFYFRGNTLNISKPKKTSLKSVSTMLKKYENFIYEEYSKIQNENNDFIKHWVTGESFYYKGTEFKLELILTTFKRIKVEFDEENKKVKISLSKEINELDFIQRKALIDKAVKRKLKEKTYELLEERVNYWSKFTNIKYTSFKVADAISKYGSCIPKTKALHFSSRLIMLPIEQIDSIIVHELCHIKYANHSDDFYNLVKVFMPDYDEKNKWIKKNNKILAI